MKYILITVFQHEMGRLAAACLNGILESDV